MHARKWYKCKWFQDVRLRVPGELAISRLPVDRPLGMVSFTNFFLSFLCWFVCWLLAISGSNQWRGAPMENKLPAAVMTEPSRFGTRDQDIASRRWPGTQAGQFFFQVFPPYFCWFFYWLLTNTVSLLWRWDPMESKLPAVAGTVPSRFGTRNLHIASRPWAGTRIGKFFLINMLQQKNKKIMFLGVSMRQATRNRNLFR